MAKKKTLANTNPAKTAEKGKKKGKGIAFENPNKVIKAQDKANRKAAQDAARMNRPTSEVNPYGSMRQYQDEQGNWRRESQLSPEQQAQLDQTNQWNQSMGNIAGGMAGQISNAYSQPFDMSGMPEAPGMEGADAYSQQMFDKAMSRYNREAQPRQQQELAQFEQMAAERGWSPGSDVYNSQRANILKSHQTERANAEDQAWQQGTNAMTSWFNTGSMARQNAVNEGLAMRDRPLQEAQALMGSRSAITNPEFTPWSTETINPSDITGMSIARMNDATQRAAIAKSGSGGGGGGGYEAMTPAQKADYEYKLDMAARYQGSGPYAAKPGKPNYGGAIGGALAEGAGAALTNWALG